MAEHENQNNRSSALTPELLAVINASIASAVQEAIKGTGALMADALRDANKPYVDPAKERRNLREKMKFKQEEIDNAKTQRLAKENCSHHYKNGLLSVALVNNFHDRQTRGICMRCHEWFYPREWRIELPTEENPGGVAKIVDAHPKYFLVVEAANQQQE
jgi:hypothetical protein